MTVCAACGQPDARNGMGGTLICNACRPAIDEQIAATRADGKAVNVGQIARKLFREQHCSGDYLLRDIPAELWQKAKHASIDRGVSLRDLILTALRRDLEDRE